jgi:hypothetical protein
MLLAHCSMRRTDSLKPEATSGHWQPASLSRTRVSRFSSTQQPWPTNGRGSCLFLDGNGPIIPATFKIDASGTDRSIELLCKGIVDACTHMQQVSFSHDQQAKQQQQFPFLA